MTAGELRVTAEKRRVSKSEFRERAVGIVTETGNPISEVADDLGINEATLASWVSRAKRGEKGKPADVDEEIARLRRENAVLKDNKEPAMERDALIRKSPVVGGVRGWPWDLGWSEGWRGGVAQAGVGWRVTV
ncbi:transposase [Streptomyces sp. SA15]|uniref:transposase n=1 Tax=Streptomyces sp. SA15 TaxID=934019 RepID=UPI0015CA4EA6|nr:transposase [Streptomyces sp. SA15]